MVKTRKQGYTHLRVLTRQEMKASTIPLARTRVTGELHLLLSSVIAREVYVRYRGTVRTSPGLVQKVKGLVKTSPRLVQIGIGFRKNPPSKHKSRPH